MQKFIKDHESPVFAQIDLKFATIVIKDGGVGSGAESVTLKIGEGNLTFSESRTIEYTLDRGLLDEVREGDQVPVDVSFDVVWTDMKGGDVKKIIKGEGYTSTDSDACRPYACDIQVTYTPSPSGCGTPSTVTLPDFRWEKCDSDLRAGTLSFSGKCNVNEIPTT